MRLSPCKTALSLLVLESRLIIPPGRNTVLGADTRRSCFNLFAVPIFVAAFIKRFRFNEGGNQAHQFRAHHRQKRKLISQLMVKAKAIFVTINAMVNMRAIRREELPPDLPTPR